MNKLNHDEILAIKFYGDRLGGSSIPIYELGSSLIALQRIVHKSALHFDDKLRKGVLLPAARRRSLALQITSHRKGSDLWGLGPYLVDPAIGPILQPLIVAGVLAIGAYAWKKIRPDKVDSPNHNLVVNIFAEVKKVADRINNVGGIEKIELSLPSEPLEKPVVIDADTRDYVRRMEHKLVPGNKTVISGVVSRILPQSFRLDLQDAPEHYVHVQLEPDQLI